MSDDAKPQEVKDVKETPRSTAEADFTKYKVSLLRYFARAPLDLIRAICPLAPPDDDLCRQPQTLSMLR